MPLLALIALLATDDVLPVAVGQTRGGIPVVAIQGGPWAVAALHARLGDDLTPAERRSVDALVAALADGSSAALKRPISADASDAGGKVKARVDPDHLAIAFGAPAEKLDVLLRSLDTLLRERVRLLPATKAPEPLAAEDPSVDAVALALAAPTAALPTSGGAPDAPALRALADKILRRERIAISVVGPLPPADLLALVLRTVVTPVAAGPPLPPTTALVLAEGTRLWERTDAAQKQTASSVWVLAPGKSTDRAARAVLARLTGGRSVATDALFGVAFDVTTPRASQAARAEAVPLKALEAVATTAPPAEIVEAVRAKERAARLERWKDADAVADVLGRALLAGDVTVVDKDLAALQQVTPDDVTAAAKATLVGPRVIVRTLGGKR